MPLVLVVIDASEQAEAAFRFYAKNLHKKGNQLLLVHSTGIPTWLANVGAYITAETWDKWALDPKPGAEKLIQYYCKLMKEHQLTGQIKWIHGERPWKAIIQMAEENHVSLIVIGTCEVGKIHRTFLGSVSDYVLHHAHCPVAISKQKTTVKKTATEDKGEENDGAEKPVVTEKNEEKDGTEKPVVTSNKSDEHYRAEKPLVTEKNEEKDGTEKIVATEDKNEEKDGAEKPEAAKIKQKKKMEQKNLW